MLISINGALVSGVVLCCLVVYRYLIYPLFFSPLTRIPNAHPTAPISPLWILWVRYQSRENHAIHEAHRKHGSVVRLGPSEISVNCVEDGIKTIYSGGFEKHAFYPNLFPTFGVHNMFSTATSKAHSHRKRMMSNVYSKSHIHVSPTMIRATERIIFERFLPRVQGIVKAGGIGDMYALLNAATMDIVTAYQFGLKHGFNFLQDPLQADWWLDLYSSRKKFTFWPAELPTLTKMLRTVGLKVVPDWVAQANSDLEESCLTLCDSAESAVPNSKEEEDHPEDIPVVYRQIKSALTKDASGDKSASFSDLPPQQRKDIRISVASELLDHLSAGHETSAITLTFLFHELGQRPELQQELRAELSTLSPPLRAASNTTSQLPSPKALDALPLLHAIIMETLRRHPAIPGAQPRLTPSTPTKLGPYTDIPPDVRVSSQAYSLHRLPSAFPAPEEWQPHRWLTAAPAQRAEMHRTFWAFSSGGRMCIGSHLAMAQMKLLVAVLVANFDLAVAEWDERVGARTVHRRGDEGIEQEDAYTARPKGEALWMRFQPAS